MGLSRVRSAEVGIREDHDTLGGRSRGGSAAPRRNPAPRAGGAAPRFRVSYCCPIPLHSAFSRYCRGPDTNSMMFSRTSAWRCSSTASARSSAA